MTVRSHTIDMRRLTIFRANISSRGLLGGAGPNSATSRSLTLALLFGLLGWSTVSMAQLPGGWATFTGERGIRVEYPSELFSISRSHPRGRTFATEDGRATLDVYTGPNHRGESPAQLLKRTFPQKRSRLTYERVTPNFFAISAPHNGRVLYRRCNFYDLTIHCIDLTYPLEEKRRWDETVTRISRSLREVL